MIEQIQNSLSSVFTPELLAATLVLALMTSTVVVGLFAHRARGAPGGPDHLWAIGWLLFLVYLAAALADQALLGQGGLGVFRDAAVGLCGLFLLWGNQAQSQLFRSRRELGLATVLVMLGSYAGHEYRSQLPVALVLFALPGGAALQLATHHWRCRRTSRGAQILAAGLGLWGIQLVLLPALANWTGSWSLGHFVLAGAALVIAMGLIVDREVAASEEKYRAVFDASSDALFMVDLFSLLVLDANQPAYRLTKRAAGTLGGVNFLDLCPNLRKRNSNVLDHRTMFNAVFKPESEFHILRADSDLTLCEGETNLVRWRERSVLQIRVRPVGDRDKFLQLVRRAEKMSALGKLIAGVAHELNNPLAVVMGYAQLLVKQRDLDETTRHELRRILHESERASKIVGDLLSFARPSEPQMVVVDVNRLVANVLEGRQADWPEHNIHLEQQLDEDLPRTKADPFQIEQVVSNLVTNAIHALSTHAGPRSLTVTAVEDAGFVHLTVADNGPGIPEQLLTKIFEPFFTTKAPGKGTGLGLPISQSIIEEHHGRMWVESEPNQGATFHIELPVVPCEEPAEVIDEPVPELAGADEDANPGGRVRRLLVVDDEPGILEVLKLSLGDAGYRVETAANGTEALRRLESSGIDLVISDLQMPDVSGEELYAKLKESQPRLARRFLFLTGDTLSPDARTFLEGCGARWFSKPFNLRDIEDAVNRILRPEPLAAILGTANPPR